MSTPKDTGQSPDVPRAGAGPTKFDDTAALEARTSFSGDTGGPVSLSQYWHNYLNKLRGGDVGSLPALFGLVIVVVFFAATKWSSFTSAFNFGSLMTQAGSICILAMGIGFVLLLGEIDLSAGVIGGVGAAVTAQLVLLENWPWGLALLAAVVVGIAMGMLTGWLVSFVGIPSFVVSLAFFLAFQGVLLWIVGNGGTIPINQPVLRGIENNNMPVALGWTVVVLTIVLYTGTNLLIWRRRLAKHLVTPPLAVVLIRSGGIAILLLLATWYLSINRAFGNNPIRGIPWIVPIIGVLLVIWTFVQQRTTFGRYVYAVGGNAEAARRAGIRVSWIKIACFVISSAMAAFSGVVEASRIQSVTAASGAGNTLLLAVAAAVIGGTSLFGGKGKARDAIIGGLVLSIIANGLGLFGAEAKINYIITGLVLLLAASVDAITRRRRAGSGR